VSANIIVKSTLTQVQYKTIASVHNSNVDHFGLDRTLKRLKAIGKVWEFQRQHVRYFIDHYPCCQKMSLLKIPIHAHGFTTSTYTPMECLNIDFVGPFPDDGYVFVIIDIRFSNFRVFGLRRVTEGTRSEHLKPNQFLSLNTRLKDIIVNHNVCKFWLDTLTSY
jgi:hypothetical protein